MKYADFQIEQIISKTKLLKVNPLMGKVVQEINLESLREVIQSNYRIIYRFINENELHILLIHHGARDLKRKFKNQKIY